MLGTLLSMVVFVCASNGAPTASPGVADEREAASAAKLAAEVNRRGTLAGFEERLPHMTMATVGRIEQAILEGASDEQVTSIGTRTAERDAVLEHVVGLVAAWRLKRNVWSGSFACSRVPICVAGDDEYCRAGANADVFIAEINATRTLRAGDPRTPYMTIVTVRQIDASILAALSDRQAKEIGTRTADRAAVQAYIGRLVVTRGQRSLYLCGATVVAGLAVLCICLKRLFAGKRRAVVL